MNIPPTMTIRVLASIPCVATIIRSAITTKVQSKKSTRLAPPKNERAQDLMEMFEKELAFVFVFAFIIVISSIRFSVANR